MLVGLRVVSRDSTLVPAWARVFCSDMELTFHLVPQHYYDSLDPRSDYVPERFSADGFIHCTDDSAEMARVANIYYGDNPEPFYYLYIDKGRVQAPIRYEDPGKLYPHIYGALNRSAIMAVRLALRAANGTFLSPEPAS